MKSDSATSPLPGAHSLRISAKNEYHREKNRAGERSSRSKWASAGSFRSLLSLCGTANGAPRKQNDTLCRSPLEITKRSQTDDLLSCRFAVSIGFVCSPLMKRCKVHGLFMYLIAANENRYEGGWKDGKKHGPGKFFYLDKGQLFEGIWAADTPKCGILIDFGRDEAPAPTQYPIPKVIAWKFQFCW